MLGKPLVRFCEGSGYNSGQGRDIVAPPENQAANREHQLRPKVWGVPDLLEARKDLLPGFTAQRYLWDAYSEEPLLPHTAEYLRRLSNGKQASDDSSYFQEQLQDYYCSFLPVLCGASVEAIDVIRGSEGENQWSEPNTKQHWANVLGISVNTLLNRIKAGEVRVQTINRQNHRLHLDDLDRLAN